MIELWAIIIFSLVFLIIPGIVFWKRNMYFVLVSREKANPNKIKQTSILAGFLYIFSGIFLSTGAFLSYHYENEMFFNSFLILDIITAVFIFAYVRIVVHK